MSTSVYQSNKRSIRRSRRLARTAGAMKAQFNRVIASPLVATTV